MIISFSVENFLSFKEEINFLMVANGMERQHKQRVPKIKKWNKKVLPVSVLYGGNASGKSNFVKAIDFARDYVLSGISKDKKIPLTPYKLNQECQKKASSFKFQFLIDDNIYEYGFEITQKEVKREWLIKITKNNDKIYFNRVRNLFNFNNWGITNQETAQFLKFLADSTLSNKLYISNVKESRIDEYPELKILQLVYEWFAELIIIRPEARFNFSKNDLSDKKMMSYLSNMLQQLDTGISTFNIKQTRIPKEKIDSLSENLPLDKSIFEFGINRIDIEEEDEFYIALEKITQHIDEKGKTVEFKLGEESDGTERLIDLLPAFFMLCIKKQQRVFIIDEFNRSLHPLLSRKLLEAYLSCCNEKTRSQLIFTSHDVMLLDQNLFRRDEIWFTERDKQGASKLSSLSDFKNVRKDKILRNDYLLGRFDGIPDIMLPFDFKSSISSEEEKKGGDK